MSTPLHFKENEEVKDEALADSEEEEDLERCKKFIS